MGYFLVTLKSTSFYIVRAYTKQEATQKIKDRDVVPLPPAEMETTITALIPGETVVVEVSSEP